MPLVKGAIIAPAKASQHQRFGERLTEIVADRTGWAKRGMAKKLSDSTGIPRRTTAAYLLGERTPNREGEVTLDLFLKFTDKERTELWPAGAARAKHIAKLQQSARSPGAYGGRPSRSGALGTDWAEEIIRRPAAFSRRMLGMTDDVGPEVVLGLLTDAEAIIAEKHGLQLRAFFSALRAKVRRRSKSDKSGGSAS